MSSGKRYNADLNGPLNIAARGLAMLLGVKPREELQAASGKSSGAVARMPLVLADIWAHAQASREHSNHPAQASGHQGRVKRAAFDASTTAPRGA